ncbi:zinc finger protein 182 isoform X2 [Bicyclus anynana]|uniref:Zinc finger protein 182 isoform X2 n=1 Tax=Bicyclus anynana TaxID=110368 RepID=A0ABM3M4F6_BICAN|nr:zinc finger protein 182 isoform X2 [Bicyclus anynana]
MVDTKQTQTMRCCVPLCTNTSDNASTSERPGITFRRLPNEVNLRDTWLKALGIQEHHLPDPAVVCSQHFSDDNFSYSESCVSQIHSNCNASTVQDIPEVEAVVIKKEDCSVYEDNCGSNEKYSKVSIKIELEGRDETLKEEIFHRKAAKSSTAVADHMTKTESCMKSESVTFGCTLCLLDFVEETAYNEHMVMHFQDAGSDSASQVCEPRAAVSRSGDSLVLQNKTGSQRLSDEPPPAAGCAPAVAASLFARFAPNYENKVQATEAAAIQREGQILETNIGELGNPSSQSGIITYIDVDSIKLEKRPKKPKKVVLDENPRARTHTAAKLYTCEICNHEFTAKCNLLMHKKIHTGEKPYSCEICNYKCAQKGSLSLHMRTHTGEKPFSCEICNSKFTAKSNLLVHKKNHTGEKPYTCEICNQKFARKFPLILHKRTHTGEKPYSCEMCDYKCIRKPNLSQHMRTHTSEKLFLVIPATILVQIKVIY